MLPVQLAIHMALASHHRSAELARQNRIEEEELMGYSPGDLQGNWQFKIVKGNFKTKEQVEAVVEEQSVFGWVLVEIFDQNRIRFKRPETEAAKDEFREGNPYSTVSNASGAGCLSMAAGLLLGAAVLVGWWMA
jgi:hypothetical protein